MTGGANIAQNDTNRPPAKLVVAQRKGGVGKTTIAVCLAGEAKRRGVNVALVDSDEQASACRWAEPGNLDFPVYEVTLASRSVADWVRLVQEISADLIVVDTAPSDRALGAAIALADLVLAPCTPSGLDIEATEQTLAIINAARARREGSPRMALVPNRVDLRTLEGRQLVDELSSLGEPVAPSVGHRSAFVRAFSAGYSIADHADGSAADAEIRQLYEFVISQINELPTLGSRTDGVW